MEKKIGADKIVFAIRFPHPGLSMSRWFQFISTSIRLDIEYNDWQKYEKKGEYGKSKHKAKIYMYI